MVERTFESILGALVEEYQIDGHKILEQEGVYYAQIELFEREAVTVVTEVNLTRIADAIVRLVA